MAIFDLIWAILAPKLKLIFPKSFSSERLQTNAPIPAVSSILTMESDLNTLITLFYEAPCIVFVLVIIPFKKAKKYIFFKEFLNIYIFVDSLYKNSSTSDDKHSQQNDPIKFVWGCFQRLRTGSLSKCVDTNLQVSYEERFSMPKMACLLSNQIISQKVHKRSMKISF